jgi:hypothetical protein
MPALHIGLSDTVLRLANTCKGGVTVFSYAHDSIFLNYFPPPNTWTMSCAKGRQPCRDLALHQPVVACLYSRDADRHTAK